MSDEAIFKDWDVEEPGQADPDRYVEVVYKKDPLAIMAGWSLALGIISILANLILGIIFAIVSKVLVNNYINRGGKYAGAVKGANATSTVGLILSILSTIIIAVRIIFIFLA